MQEKAASAPLLVAILAGMAMIGPFSVDTYLPSFPAIAREFSATPLEVQQTLSVYLATFAMMTLFQGTLSDSFGRRPVVVGCLLIYTLASIGCAAAQSFGQLLFFRGAQGLAGGAGWVIGRAIVRDVFEGHRAQRILSVVTMIFGLAPAVAPLIGGALQAAFGWRSVFVFLVAYGAIMLVVVWRSLPETHPLAVRQPFALAPLARNYWKLGSHPLMALLCLAVAFNFIGLFLYITSAPAIIYDLLELTERHFPALFVPTVGGIMIGAFLSGRLAGRVSPRRTVAIGYAIMIGAAGFSALFHAFNPPSLAWSVPPIACYAAGMALSAPCLQLLMLDLFPGNRGLASSLQGFTQSLFSALAAGVISPLVYGSAATLAATGLAMSVLGLACWLAYRRLSAGRR